MSLHVVRGEHCIIRDRCPWCGSLVRIIDHKMQPHQRSICTGRHIEWEECGGAKDYVEPTTTDLWSEAWGSMKW